MTTPVSRQEHWAFFWLLSLLAVLNLLALLTDGGFFLNWVSAGVCLIGAAMNLLSARCKS